MTANPIHQLKRFTRGLSFKLSFGAGLIMFLALMAFAYHSIREQERNLTSKMVQVALKDSEVVKAAIWHGMMKKDREVIGEIVKTIGNQAELGEINIFDRGGVLRYSSHADAAGQTVSSLPEPLKRGIGTLRVTRHRISDDGKWLSVVNPLLNTESCSSAACHAHPASQKTLGALAVRLPLGNFRQEIYSNARETMLIAAFLFVFISSVIGLVVLFLVNPSLKRLQQSAMRVSRGEYEPQTPEKAWFDDLGDLSRSFDEMSRRISERTDRLDSQRKFWKSLYDDVPCYLTTVSADYRITTANKTFRDVFGDQVGQNCFAGYKGATSRCDDCPVEKTFNDGQQHQSEEIWKQDGRAVCVIVKTAPILDNTGTVSEVLEMSLDVTKLKKLQMELDSRRRAYKNLFQLVPGYLTVVDSDFNIVQVNKQFYKDFGNRIGEKCFSAYKERGSRCEDCPVAETFADGLTHTSEHVWFKSGEEVHLVVRTSPVTDEHGEIVAVMEMCTDVTEIKRLQNELVLLGETIAGMSHTIKNILAGLEGGVYLVDSGLEHDKSERVRDGWAMVKHNVGKVSDLVKGILYASKERVPDYQECDPGELLSEVCDLYQDKARSEGIDLLRHFEPRMPSGLLDPAGIHSVLSNLLSNAIEACRGRTEKRNHVIVYGTVAEGRLTVRVEDNGPGMAEEVKRRLFERFYSTKGSRGTGLGLVIARKVINEHGGSINVESERGKGTVFSFDIPFPPTSDERGLRKAV